MAVPDAGNRRDYTGVSLRKGQAQLSVPEPFVVRACPLVPFVFGNDIPLRMTLWPLDGARMRFWPAAGDLCDAIVQRQVAERLPPPTDK